jgi:hypothetical protein
VNSNPAHGEVYSIQVYVIKFVSDLSQIDGFLRMLRFPPPIKQSVMIKKNIVEMELNAITLTHPWILSL